MKVDIVLTGTAQLIQHNVRLADPFDPIPRAIKEISGKRKKTDEDLQRMEELEFEGGLYIHESLGPYIPGANIEKCIVEGARVTRQGKQIERGFLVNEMEVPLIYNGPRDRDGLWADSQFRSRMSVKIGTSRVMRCRPWFPEWALEFTATVDPGQLNLDTLQAIVADAGSMVGLGDYRPRYGRFEGKVKSS